MTTHDLFRFSFRVSALAIVMSLATAGCNKTIDDATLTTNVHNALAADASIANQPIQPTVAAGVVTLNGNVSDDTARMVAAQDAAHVEGVKEVVNALNVQGIAVTPDITTAAAPKAPRIATPQEQQAIATHQPLPSPAATSSAAPPPPVYRDVAVPAGREISVRINQGMDSEHTEEGATFTGVVSRNVIVDGELAIPAGASVTGHVVAVHNAGHYKGNSLLSLELTRIGRRGESIAISTDPYTLEGKGRGKNTAEKIGGGAAIGAVLGGIFGGGKGAAIGAAAGGGGGAVVNGVTRGEQVGIPSESIIRFRLSNGFSVRSYGQSAEQNDAPNSPGLQQRQP